MGYSVHPPVTAEEWLFSCVFEKKKKSIFRSGELGLTKRELLKCHESFPILVFRGVYQ